MRALKDFMKGVPVLGTPFFLSFRGEFGGQKRVLSWHGGCIGARSGDLLNIFEKIITFSGL